MESIHASRNHVNVEHVHTIKKFSLVNEMILADEHDIQYLVQKSIEMRAKMLENEDPIIKVTKFLMNIRNVIRANELSSYSGAKIVIEKDETKYLDLIKFLIEQGICISVCFEVLHWSVLQGFLSIVKHLVRHGVDISNHYDEFLKKSGTIWLHGIPHRQRCKCAR